jgi:hypothetical protein
MIDDKIWGITLSKGYSLFFERLLSKCLRGFGIPVGCAIVYTS